MQYAVWIFLIILGFLFVKNRGVAAAILIFDWILFAFNRGNADYIPYFQIFNHAKISASVDFISESGWQFLCVLSRDFFHMGYESFRAFVSTIALIILFCGAIHFTKNIALFMALFNVFPMLLFIVQIRSFLAFAIVFFGIRFLEKKNTPNVIAYILLVILATTIHTSSLFYLLFLIVVYIDNSKLTKAVLIWCIAGIAIVLPLFTRFSGVFGKYSKYLKGEVSTFSKICILILMIGLHYSVYQSHRLIHQSVSENEKKSNRAVIFSDISLGISTLSFVMLPIMYYISIEAMRYVRYISVIDYVIVSLTSYKLHSKRAHFIQLFILAIAAASCWYWQMSGDFMNTVFKSCMENNSVLQFLLS